MYKIFIYICSCSFKSLIHNSSYLGLRFRLRESHKKCLSITYASIPGVKPTPLRWSMFCDPGECVGGQYVTYHELTDSDDSLSAVVGAYSKSKVIGLIIINSTSSLVLSNEFINKKSEIPQSSPSVYVVSSFDGEQLKSFLAQNERETIEVKVSVESTVDSVGRQLSGLYVI